MPTSSFIEIEGAHLMRLHQPGKLVARYPTLWLVKSEIVVILLSGRNEMGPTGFTRGGYTTNVPHWVRVIMGGYDSLTAILFPNVEAESAAMIFNRRMVDAVAMLPKDEIPKIPG
jgi:hypothetical protein